MRGQIGTGSALCYSLRYCVVTAVTYLGVTSTLFGCNSHDAKTLGEVTHFSEELQNPARTINVVSIPRAALKTSYKLVALTGPDGFLAPTTITATVAKLFNAAISKPIAAINGTWLTAGPRWKGTLRGPYVIRGELLQLAGLGTHDFARVFWISEDDEVWLGGLRVTVELQLESGFKTSVRLNTDAAPAGIKLYTAGATSATAVNGATPSGYQVPSISGTDFVLAPASSGEANLRFPPQFDGAGTAQKFYIKRVSPAGKTMLASGELALSVDATLSAGTLEQFTGLHVGSIVTFTTSATIVERYGSCSPSADAGAIAPTTMATSGGTVLLEVTSESGSRFPEFSLPAARRQPRTPQSAICWNDERFYLVAVDGVGPNAYALLRTMLGLDTSTGITMGELTEYMQNRLKCSCAITLDGGESTALHFDGSLVNSPSHGTESPTNGIIAILPRGEIK